MSNNMNDRFVRIGAGFCGSVWAAASDEDDQSGMAFKREDGGPGRSLRNDFDMQHRVIAAMQEFEGMGNFSDAHADVPQCHDYITPGEEGWWEDKLVDAFPGDYSP